jgi:hypothetical protein
VATVFLVLEVQNPSGLANGIQVMWKKLKRGYRQFADDQPGRRFIDTYKRWKGSSGNPIIGIAVIAVGVVLIVIGALLALVPGVPGIVLGVLGLALIATRFRWMAGWLDWFEVKCRRGWQRFRRRHAPR